jgi:hypothetical protein
MWHGVGALYVHQHDLECPSRESVALSFPLRAEQKGLYLNTYRRVCIRLGKHFLTENSASHWNGFVSKAWDFLLERSLMTVYYYSHLFRIVVHFK